MARDGGMAAGTVGSGTPPPLAAAHGALPTGLRLFPSTLAGRLVLTYALVVAVVLAILGLALAQSMKAAYTDDLSGAMEQDARVVRLLIAQAGDGGDDIGATVRQAADALDARVIVSGPNGEVIQDSANTGDAAATGGDAPSGSAPAPSAGADASYLWVSVPISDPAGGAVRIGRPLDGVDAAVAQLQNLVVGATLAATVLVAVVGIVVAGRIGGPLEDLRQQAAAVARGRLDVAVRPADTRELGELGIAFNAMTGRLRGLLDELARARGRLEATLANLTDGVVIVDVRGVVLLLNPAARRMLGVTGATAGRPFVEVSRDHELDALVRSSATSFGPVAASIQHGRTGRTIDATAQRVESGEEELSILVLRDVTELRRLENVRREFVANVSHELRTPLASIRLVVETLEAGAIEDPAVSHGFLRRIVGETDRLALLVDDLLDLARLESGRVRLQVEPIPAGDLVAGGVDRLRPQVERARLSLVVDVPGGLPVVRADRARIEQVLINLIHNAIKFTPPGGEIRISARAAADALEIAVADNGVGVTPDELPRLFERFYKADKARRSEGTGLGLAIAKHIVMAHGGTIAADSVPGRGATFTVTLPLAGPPLDEGGGPVVGGFPGTMR